MADDGPGRRAYVGAMNSTTLASTTSTHTPLLVRGGAVLAAGGLSWLTKMAVIAATDGAEKGTGDALASVFYLGGFALMAAGLATVAVALTAGRHVVLRAAAGIAGLVSFFFAYVAIEGVAKSINGDAGPTWFPDEVGILATGAVMAAAGMLLIRRSA
jgi:hypothetical protein